MFLILFNSVAFCCTLPNGRTVRHIILNLGGNHYLKEEVKPSE